MLSLHVSVAQVCLMSVITCVSGPGVSDVVITRVSGPGVFDVCHYTCQWPRYV